MSVTSSATTKYKTLPCWFPSICHCECSYQSLRPFHFEWFSMCSVHFMVLLQGVGKAQGQFLLETELMQQNCLNWKLYPRLHHSILCYHHDGHKEQAPACHTASQPSAMTQITSWLLSIICWDLVSRTVLIAREGFFHIKPETHSFETQQWDGNEA